MASTAVALSSTAVAMASAPKDLSAKANSFSTSASSLASLSLRRQSSRTVLRRPFAVTASASKEESSAQNFAAALALAAVIASTPLAVAPLPASADVAGLTPCKESKAFAKREKQEIKKLQSRLKNYSPESAPALAINATIEKTKRRFDFYGKQGLLCGTDGLPHLIVDGDQAHLGEFVYPGILFLYIAGWIGWVGRSYLIQTRTAKKPTEKEIIIDVPLATKLIWRGFIWPLAAISEFRNGKLVEDAANITVSPR